MLFNIIPIWEGNFLTLIALCPLQGGGNQELPQDPVQCLANDRCLKYFSSVVITSESLEIVTEMISCNLLKE